MNQWVYYVVLYNHHQNAYRRFLLTARDIEEAERNTLMHLPHEWTAHHSEMVCATNEPFFREL